MKKVTNIITCLSFSMILWLFASMVVCADSQSHTPRPTPTDQHLKVTTTVEPNAISPQGAFPDLVVKSITADPNVTAEPLTVLKGVTVTITVEIENQGAVGVGNTNDFWADLFIDPASPPIVWDQSNVGIAWFCQGSLFPAHTGYAFTASIPGSWLNEARTYNFWIVVDSEDSVLEDDEDNNVFGPIAVQVVPSNKHEFATHQQVQKLGWSNADTSELSDSKNSQYAKGAHLRYNPVYFSADPSLASFGDAYATEDVSLLKAEIEKVGANPLSLELISEIWQLGVQKRDTYTELLQILDSEPVPEVALSPMDYSDTSGVMRLGIFQGDVAVSDRGYGPPTSPITDAHQMATVMAVDPTNSNNIYAIWQDDRNGQWYNNCDLDCNSDAASEAECQEFLPLPPADDVCRTPEDNTDIYFDYSTDGGYTWHGDMKVNHDSTISWQRAPDLAISPDGSRVYAVWEDRSNGANYDIFFNTFNTASHTWSDGMSISGLADTCNPPYGNQTAPSITVDSNGYIYVVWVDDRSGNDDIYFTMSRDGGATWGGWSDTANGGEGCIARSVRVNDFTNLDRQANPVIDVSAWVESSDYITGPVVFVAWEDWRNGNADVYLSASVDVVDDNVTDPDRPDSHLPTFGIDVQVPAEELENDQLAPDIVAFPVFEKDKNFVCDELSVQSPYWVNWVGLVWRDVTVDNESAIWFIDTGVIENLSGTGANFPCFDSNRIVKVSTEETREWQSLPVWHSDPVIAATPRYTPIGSGTTVSSTITNVFVAWTDGRNYDDWNYDIYIAQMGWSFLGTEFFRRFGKDIQISDWSKGAVLGWHILPDANVVLNDNVKLSKNTNIYNRYFPAPAHQRRPSLWVDWNNIYLMWDDDRNGLDPFWDRDVFFARSSSLKYTGSATWLSPPLSANGQFPWVIVDWADSTDYGTDVQVQVRVSNDGINWNPYGCGAYDGWFGNDGKCGGWFDAPGQSIYAPGTTLHPSTNYLQMRARLRSFLHNGLYQKTPLVSSLVVYYKDPQFIYLPIIMRNYGAP